MDKKTDLIFNNLLLITTMKKKIPFYSSIYSMNEDSIHRSYCGRQNFSITIIIYKLSQITYLKVKSLSKR